MRYAQETPLANLFVSLLERVGAPVENFGDSETVQRPLVDREALPITVAERLVSKVSDSLRNYLVTHHELPPALASCCARSIAASIRLRAGAASVAVRASARAS